MRRAVLGVVLALSALAVGLTAVADRQDEAPPPAAAPVAAPAAEPPQATPAPPAAPAPAPAVDPVLWPERQRAFLQDGPGLLLTAAQRAELVTAPAAERDAVIASFLAADPDPATPLNELAEGIERRRQLVRAQFLSPLDVRARLLFLNGAPASREEVDCGVAFKPIELWSYPGRPGGPGADRPGAVLLYRPTASDPFRIWLPPESKRVLYTSEMEYWLEQWEDLGGRRAGRRFDRQVCEQAKTIDEVTGVRALRDYQPGRPTAADYERFLAPPDDLAAWAAVAAATPLPDPPPRLAVGDVAVVFPAVQGQRTLVRVEIALPAGSGAEAFVDPDRANAEPELRLAVDAEVEQDGQLFDEFRARYRPQPPAEDAGPLPLVLERPLRPDRAYLLRLRIRDEVNGAQIDVARGFTVPREPTPGADRLPAAGAVVPLDADLGGRTLAGRDSLILVPPEGEVVFGLWRAEALVAGDRITRVSFLLDGVAQLTRSRRPFTAELRLAELPTPQVARAEGYDDAGALVAADEVMLNQARGPLAVEIVEPRRGFSGSGKVTARAEVTVPEDRRVERVEFRLNDALVATLEKPPWTAEIEVPAGEEITYLAAVAVLDDGRSAEAVRFLNAPRFLEQVEVRLVELYVAVLDREGHPVTGLAEGDFEVFEGGRPQQIRRFERVENLPLAVGVAIDTSGSMVSSLAEAQRAGKDFLGRVMTARDRCFVLGFAAAPKLLMAPTDDAAACLAGLDELRAIGSTALHDAVATSLYYFRAMRGQKALVLLSDGDDTSSTIAFPSVREYARRSGVAIYPVGLGVTALSFKVRGKLNDLAAETGGRVFFISRAEELSAVYGQIEEELRGRYLVAYEAAPEAAAGDGQGGEQGKAGFREVEVKMKPRGLTARTIRGYYP